MRKGADQIWANGRLVMRKRAEPQETMRNRAVLIFKAAVRADLVRFR